MLEPNDDKECLLMICVCLLLFVLVMMAGCKNVAVSVNMLNNRSSMAHDGEALNETKGGGELKGNKLK